MVCFVFVCLWMYLKSMKSWQVNRATRWRLLMSVSQDDYVCLSCKVMLADKFVKIPPPPFFSFFFFKGTLNWISNHLVCPVHGLKWGCWKDTVIKFENILSNEATSALVHSNEPFTLTHVLLQWKDFREAREKVFETTSTRTLFKNTCVENIFSFLGEINVFHE